MIKSKGIGELSIFKLFDILKCLENSKIKSEEVIILDNNIRLRVSKIKFGKYVRRTVFLFSESGSTLFRISYSKNYLEVLGTHPNTTIFDSCNLIKFSYGELKEMKDLINSGADETIINLTFKGRDSYKSFSILNSPYFNIIHQNKEKIRGVSQKMIVLFAQGNPGKDYTIRHNLGFLLLDFLLYQYNKNNHTNLSWKNKTTHQEVRVGNFLFVKPMTGYNISGTVASNVLNFYKVDLSDLLVIHDDIDLDPCRIKTKIGGSSSGNNGIKSLDKELGSSEYYRMRIGVGRPGPKVNGGFVCGTFTQTELDNLEKLFSEIAPLFWEINLLSKESLKDFDRK